MSDKNATETLEMENMKTMNCTGNSCSSSKDTETENVEAIKKYIEEQEIILRHDSLNRTVQENREEKLQNELKNAEQMHREKVHLQDTLELESEESLVNEAAANLLSLSQSGSEKQTSIDEFRQTDQVFYNHSHEQILIPMPETVSEVPSNDTSEKVGNNQVVCSNTNDERNVELNSNVVSTKKIEIDEHILIENENKLQKMENMDEVEKPVLLNPCSGSDLETKTTSGECDCRDKPNLLHQLLTETKESTSDVKIPEEINKTSTLPQNKEQSEESLAIATSVMNMILNDTEAAINKKKASGALAKQCFSPEKVNSSVSLAIGSKVEAKDFCELWHPAQIIEVDCEEMEVLVQYDNQPKMHNEWINISSPRLRPLSSSSPNPMSPVNTPAPKTIVEQKLEDKQKLTFAVGERCLARWRDNRRFLATVQNEIGNGDYEVVFDDGFVWKCSSSRLYKVKESPGKHEYARFGTGPSARAPAPLAPAAAPAANGFARLPAYHTHLFDPSRDYLGSKSERREMKRKINIKEIFNIGQKRKRPSIVDKERRSPVCIKEEVKSETCAGTPPPMPDLNPQTKSDSKETISALQVKKAVKRKPPVKKKPLTRKKIKLKTNTNVESLSLNNVKKEIPEAVASIIGTICKIETEEVEVKLEPLAPESKDSNANDIKPTEQATDDVTSFFDIQEKRDIDVKIKEEPIEKFDVRDGVKHEEVIGKIKEVITKLEDGINEVERNDAKPPETKEPAVAPEEVLPTSPTLTISPIASSDQERLTLKLSKIKKSSSKVKKGKKLRLMQEKKVKKQVAQVKCQLEEMKKQVEAMRKEIMLKTEELASSRRSGPVEAPESCLLPGEWCCRWVDGQPLGAVSEVQHDRDPPAAAAAAAAATAAPLPRRSVQVEDKRLPPGWTKHMVRRSLGSSAGKWDVVLVSPDNRRIHTKSDMKIYLENNGDESLKPFQAALTDFGIHLKLARRMGWVRSSADGAPPPPPGAAPAPSSPLLKRPKLSLKKNHHKLMHAKKLKTVKLKPPRLPTVAATVKTEQKSTEADLDLDPVEATLDGASIKDGFVHVGSLRVQVIETLLRCPAEGCLKNFRNTMLLKMHIKHYHRELRKSMGNTPKVLDLAYARTRPSEAEMKRLKCEAQQRIIKVKLPRLHKRVETHAPAVPKEVKIEPAVEPRPATPPLVENAEPKPQESPKLRNALVSKPPKRPKVLLPVRTKELEPAVDAADAVGPAVIKLETAEDEKLVEPKQEIPDCGVLDFETAISTHTVTKLVNGGGIKSEKKRKTFACFPRLASSDEEWGAGSDPDTRSSYPSCGTPDSKGAESDLPAQDLLNHNNAYMYTENGERIKLVRMKREEIINCHCGFREEDGLMVQCELCLCWQHALCHNIQRECEVPEKYTCSICLNPRRGRRRQRFMHDQDRLYEGLLPGPGGGRACDALRRAHELSGNLLRIEDALHAVRVNTRVAATKNHPKLYLWARDWESLELTFAQEKLNSEYSDLNVIINNLGKENLPIKAEDLKEMALDIKPSSDGLEEKHAPKEGQLGPAAVRGGLRAGAGGAHDSENLSKPLQEPSVCVGRVGVGAGAGAGAGPQPEAAIENSACRARLLRHVQRCHALLDQRLDSIEAQVAELESQDASLEDDETANFYPRTKQTMLMISRDLDTMEELGIVT